MKRKREFNHIEKGHMLTIIFRQIRYEASKPNVRKLRLKALAELYRDNR